MGRENLNEARKEPLSLYINYEYLPSQQQAEILRLIPLIYERLMFPAELKMPYKRDRHFDWPPLCIISVETGNSIEFKFKPSGEYLPSLEKTGEGDLQIWLPKWTIVPVATAAVLATGMAFLDQTHEFYREHISDVIESKSMQEEESSGDTKEDNLVPLRLKDFEDKDSPGYRQLKYLHREFHRQIDFSNIRSAKVNGYVIKASEDNTDG